MEFSLCTEMWISYDLYQHNIRYLLELSYIPHFDNNKEVDLVKYLVVTRMCKASSYTIKANIYAEFYHFTLQLESLLMHITDSRTLF